MKAKEAMRSRLAGAVEAAALQESPEGEAPSNLDGIVDKFEETVCSLLADEEFQRLIEDEAAERGPFPDFLERRVVGFSLDLVADVVCGYPVD